MDVMNSNMVITRIPHKCWGCTRIIPKKSIMRVITTKDSGEFSRAYWCKECQDALDKLDHDDDGYSEGELLDVAYTPERRKEILLELSKK